MNEEDISRSDLIKLLETYSRKIERVRWVFEENASDLLDRPADPELKDTVCEVGSALLGLDRPLYDLEEVFRLVTKPRGGEDTN